MTIRCSWCDKEFTPDPKYPTKRFCCYSCKVAYHGAISKIKSKIKRIMLANPNYHVEQQQLQKIIKAKMLIFRGKDKEIHRCPCDSNNPKRYCGSQLCKQDILYDGHCHCNLFWVRENKD